MRPTFSSAAKRGFTLIEILLVVVVIGILAAAIGPAVGGMLSGGKIRTAARELAGAERYARSMALLNQTPVDLVVDLEGGSFRVVAREREAAMRLGLGDLAALTNDVGYTDALLAKSARRRASLSGGFGLARSGNDLEAAEKKAGAEGTNTLAVLESGAGRSLPAEVSFSQSIDFERKLEGVAFSFGGYRDVVRPSARDEDWSAASDKGTVVVHFRANGTVRPHSIAVYDTDAPDDRLNVFVNSVGAPSVLPPGEKP